MTEKQQRVRVIDALIVADDMLELGIGTGRIVRAIATANRDQLRELLAAVARIKARAERQRMH